LDVLASDPAIAAADAADAADLFTQSRDTVLRIGEGRDVVVIGGHVELNRGGEDLLLSALAPVTHIHASAAEAPVLRWLLDRLATPSSAPSG
jgi:hypothetical protein